MNTASRMESNSEVNRIHCSEAAANLLIVQKPDLSLTSRGLINVKGKGLMQTFWVNCDRSKICPVLPDEPSFKNRSHREEPEQQSVPKLGYWEPWMDELEETIEV